MKRIYLFFCVLLMCSSAFSQLPEAGKKYMLKHVDTGLYLTINASQSGNVSSIDEYIGDDSQIMELPSTSDGYYNIAATGQYLTGAGNGWDVVLGSDPDSENAKFQLIPDEENITIQYLPYLNTNMYFTAQGSAPGTGCYLDTRTYDARWLLEEFIEPDELEVVTFTPAEDKENVALNPDINILFNKAAIEAGDFSKITIKDAQNNSVGNITAAINGFRLVISCDQLEFGTVYTVTLPAGTIADYNQEISWSFTTVYPISIDPDKMYYIRYADTPFYIGRADENVDTRVSIRAKNPDFLVQFTEVADRPGIYNIIRVLNGDYLYSQGDYSVYFGPLKDGVLTAVKIENAEEYASIQFVDKSGNNYFGVNSPASGQNTASDKAANEYIFWSLEEFDENAPVEVSALTPQKDATLVSPVTDIRIAFSKFVEGGDLSGITIVDENSNVLDGIQVEIDGRYLVITYPGQLTGYTTYTVTIPVGAIVDYTSEISWSFTTANPVLPKAPQLYTLKNKTTGLYLTYPEVAPANESVLMVADKIDGSGSERQEFRFTNPDPANPDLFNIAVFSGEYITRGTGSLWEVTLGTEEISEYSLFNIVPDGDEIRLEVLVNQPENGDYYLGVNAPGSGDYVCYLDRWNDYSWILEQVEEDVDIFKVTPGIDELNVLLDAEIKATFNQSIEAIDLSLISVKDEDGNSADGIRSILDDYIITIGHDGLKYGKTYTVTIPVGAIEDLNTAIAWSFTTRDAPAIVSTIPASGATGVDVGNVVLEITSSDPITDEDFDDITIEDTNGNAVTITDGTVNGSRLTLAVNDILEYNATYTVTVPAGTITDIEEYSWSFTTTSEPVLVSTSPADGATDINPTATVSVSFDKIIYEEDFSGITLKDASGEDYLSSVSKSGSRLNIAKSTLEYNTVYTVTIPANSVKGIAGEIKFSFTTAEGLGIHGAGEDAISVYPAVSKGNVTVTTPGDAWVQVVDVAGNKLAVYETSGLLDIRLDYPDGLYLILVEDRNGYSSHKVILQK